MNSISNTSNSVTVPVPEDRTAEFYQFFGLWLAGSLSLAANPNEGSNSSSEVSQASEPVTLKAWADDDESAEDAEFLWKKFSPHARNMFGLLADDPGTKYTGDQIASAVGIPNGKNGVAGVLAWPGRFCAPLGRPLPTRWEEDAQGVGYYSMADDVADLFKGAREKVESG